MAEVIGRLFDKECRASVSKIDFEGVDTMGSHSMNPTIMLSYGWVSLERALGGPG